MKITRRHTMINVENKVYLNVNEAALVASHMQLVAELSEKATAGIYNLDLCINPSITLSYTEDAQEPHYSIDQFISGVGIVEVVIPLDQAESFAKRLEIIARDKHWPQAGQVVRLTGDYNGVPAGSYAMINGIVGQDCKEDVHITFRFIAFHDGSIVSSSGGPGAMYIPAELLVQTDDLDTVTCWRWNQHGPGAGNGEDFYLLTNVWEWDGQLPQA